MLSKPSPTKTREWLDNVDMHLYAKFDQAISSSSRAMRMYTTVVK